jgi:hypothetical protein
MKCQVVRSCIITMVVMLHAWSTMQAQAIVRYRQCSTTETDSYHAHQMVQLNNDGDVLIYPAKRAFLSLSIPTRTARILETPPSLLPFDFMDATPTQQGVIGTVRSINWRGFAWTRDSGIVERFLPSNGSSVTSSVNGPMAITSNGYYSCDDGLTWKEPTNKITHGANSILEGALPVRLAVGDPNRYYLLFRERSDTLFPAWSAISDNVRLARRYGRDSLLCFVGNTLRCSAIGDTVLHVIDSIIVGDSYRKLKPRYIESLADSTVLYCDANGWYGTIRGMKIDKVVAITLGRDYIPMWQTMGTAYWIEPLRDSMCVYKISLTSPPQFDVYYLPFEFSLAEQVNSHCPQTFGADGISIHWGDSRDYIIDLHDSEAVILMYGSILDPVVEYLSQRRMITSWLNPAGVLHALDDLGNSITVDTARVGYLTHPLVTFSMDDQIYTAIGGTVPPKGRGWRESGTPLPTRWNSSLVFPGPVIRRFSLDGRLLDTLVRVPVCFASTIDDSILATGTKGVVRLQTSTRFDTTLLASASNIVADTIGYPSSMTRARDGALVLTMLGTSFLHRDSAEAKQRRWGGILRSTNEGKTWTTVSIPSTGSYVMHCMRTSSGVLIASTMLMVEDSTHPVDLNAPESYYTASNIEIMRSNDDGRTWSITGTAFYSGPFQPCTGNIIETAPGVLYAATLAGVMISSDDGRTWSGDEQLPATAQPASVSRGTTGVLVATTQGVYELPTTSSVPHEINATECRPIAVNKVALQQIMQQHHVDRLLLCDVNGRTTTLTLSSDLAALPLGLYTVLSSDIAAVLSSVLIVE